MSTNPRSLDARWRHIALPVVAPTLCTACGWCVEICPTDCLAMGSNLPRLARPLDCVSCSVCVLICPADALQMNDEPEA